MGTFHECTYSLFSTKMTILTYTKLQFRGYTYQAFKLERGGNKYGIQLNQIQNDVILQTYVIIHETTHCIAIYTIDNNFNIALVHKCTQ